ncbi:MAG: hypothetical protein KF754_10990, partial [Planctomycetes bacterium]|nr:hypothetical protein [Planctomycetota bacterium]
MTGASLLYSETIRPARIGVLMAMITVAEAAGAGLNFFLQGPFWVTLLLAGCVLLFGLLALMFWELSVSVHGDRIELGWARPLLKRVRLAEVRGARVEPYRALKFGGWGWRMGMGGAMAYSDFGIKDALVLELANGRELHVTLRDAQAAATAVAKALAPS